jgi:hypothetical protein
LTEDRDIGLGNGHGIKLAIRMIWGIGSIGTPHSSVDYEVCNMDALRTKLASRALGKAS